MKQENVKYLIDIINMFAMAKLMEMKTAEQNKVTLYLFNTIYYV